MVEAVNNAQVQPVTKRDNSVRNGVIAGTAGLVGAGSMGYATKQIMKDGAFTDEFIKEVQKQVINAVVDEKVTVKKAVQALFKMKETPTINAVKKFLQKHGKTLIDEINSDDIKELLKKSDNEIMERYKYLKAGFEGQIGCKLRSLPEKIKGCLEEGKNLFTKQEAYKNNDGYNAILKAQHEVKGKAGLIRGAASGLVLGTGAYIVSKMSGSKEA